MLKDCLEIFLDEYGNNLEKVISDGEELEEGLYLIVDKDGNLVDEIKEVKKRKPKEKSNNNSEIVLIKVKSLNYLSRILSMNKAVHPKKKISSNNYLSFFVKKEALKKETPESKKLKEEFIDEYYDLLENYKSKLNKNQKAIMDDYNPEENYDRNKEIDFNKNWIKRNIFNLEDKFGIDLDNNGYVKIFFVNSEEDFEDYEMFDELLEKYRIESNKYFYPNIFLDKGKIEKTGELYKGPFSKDVTLNDKKPFLSNKSRKNEILNLIDVNEALKYKMFYDYLTNFCNKRKYHIYFYSSRKAGHKIEAYENNNPPNEVKSGYYLRIKKGMSGAEVLQFDVLNRYKSGEFIDPIRIRNYAGLKLDKNSNEPIKYYDWEINTRGALLNILDKKVYNGKLYHSLNENIEDMSKISANFKLALRIIKEDMIEFTFKIRNPRNFYKNFKESTNLVINQALKNDEAFRAKTIFNIQRSVLNWMKGDCIMDRNTDKIVEDFKVKLNTDFKENTPKIYDDREYCYALGQALAYIMSHSKARTPKVSLYNSFLRTDSNTKLREDLRKLFIKYNSEMDMKSKRLNNILAMIYGYDSLKKIDRDMLMYGIFSRNLLYEKKYKEEKSDDEK